MGIQLESVEISNFKSIVSCALPLSVYTPLITLSAAAGQWAAVGPKN